VQASLDYCRQVTRSRAGNFYFGLMLTPKSKRAAMYTIYAFMRACDDLADAPAPGNASNPEDGSAPASSRRDAHGQLQRIEQFRAVMQRVLDGGPLPAPDELPPAPDAQRFSGGVWPAFRHVVQRHAIDPNHLHAMLDGQCADLTTTHYQSFDQLYRYCYNVASVVGLVCVSIWGCHTPDGRCETGVLQLAEYRGIALQLTNILRDVAEDAQRGRVYLPREDLERFGYPADGFLRGDDGSAFERLMRFQIERARSYYDMAAPLEKYLDPGCRATSWALMRIYHKLLDKIANNPRRVLRQRVRLSTGAKLMIAAKALLRSGRET
jgi:phytoene synthase